MYEFLNKIFDRKKNIVTFQSTKIKCMICAKSFESLESIKDAEFKIDFVDPVPSIVLCENHFNDVFDVYRDEPQRMKGIKRISVVK